MGAKILIDTKLDKLDKLGIFIFQAFAALH
jgi:hypothetical protein